MDSRPDIVIFLADTVRADVLPPWGGREDLAPVVAEFAREGPHPVVDGTADGIGDAQPLDGRHHRGGDDIDDAAVPRRPHARHDRPHDRLPAEHVGREPGEQILGRRVDERSALGPPAVVDQDVGRSGLCQVSRHGLPGGGPVAHVTGQQVVIAPAPGEPLAGGFERGRVAGEQRQRRPLRRQRLGACQADALGSTAHQRVSSRKRSTHGPHCIR